MNRLGPWFGKHDVPDLTACKFGYVRFDALHGIQSRFKDRRQHGSRIG
jgi:hypothetical protein